MKFIFQILKFLVPAAAILIPVVSSAHGLNPDGHNAVLDYIELGGIGVASIGLLLFSFDKWRKENRKK
jgi:hypothetical protein